VYLTVRHLYRNLISLSSHILSRDYPANIQANIQANNLSTGAFGRLCSKLGLHHGACILSFAIRETAIGSGVRMVCCHVEVFARMRCSEISSAGQHDLRALQCFIRDRPTRLGGIYCPR